MTRWLPVLLLVATTLLVHGNTLGNGFVWDDETIIVKNRDTRDISRLGHVLLSPDDRPPYYRPLNRASYLLDFQAFGMNPLGFHLVNVTLQVACVLALYGLGLGIFSARLPALIAATLLAVHPIATEVVAFVTARNNLFALLFSLVSLWLFVEGDARRSRWRIWLSAIAFFLGLASKEPAAMVLPVMASWIVIEGGTWRDRLERARRLLPHLAFLGVYLGLRAVSLGGLVGSSPATSSTAPLARAGAIFMALPTYLGLIVFPRGLTIYHVVPETSGSVLAGFALAWIAIVGAVIWLLRRRSPPISLGLAWLGFGLLPIANLVSLPTATVIAERYFYIPAVGLWIIAGDLFASAWERSRQRGLLAGAAVAVVVALGARTIVRNRDWRDDLTLARAAVEVEPGAPIAQYNLGLALQESGDPAGARLHWEESARIDRVDGRALVSLGKLAADRNELAMAEAYFNRSLEMMVGPVEGRLNLGKLYDRLGDTQRARSQWEAVLRTEPLHADANAQLGVLDAAQGNLASAERRFRVSIRSDPDLAEAWFNLARILEATGRSSEAIPAYETFLRVRGSDSEAAARFASQRLVHLRGAVHP
jgi:tetratricopeptide (TPR) repeat protein